MFHEWQTIKSSGSVQCATLQDLRAHQQNIFYALFTLTRRLLLYDTHNFSKIIIKMLNKRWLNS